MSVVTTTTKSILFGVLLYLFVRLRPQSRKRQDNIDNKNRDIN